MLVRLAPRTLLREPHRWRREGSGMRMGRRQVRALLAGSAGKVFAEWVKDGARAGTGDADDEARPRKATEGVCGKVTSELFAPKPSSSISKIAPQSRCVRDRSSAIDQIVR